MESLQSQDGHPFIRAVAQYIRQHEKALANSLQLTVQRRKPQLPSSPPTPTSPTVAHQSSTNTLAAALSFAGLSFKSHNIKSAQLTLTPHHLFYLLSRIEELDVNVGPMNVRVENIHNDSSSGNYISFLQAYQRPQGRSDTDSIHSVSSVRSVMSGMSALWSSMGLASSSKTDKARLALENDVKYIYGAFTKLPALRLTPDHRTPLIKGYEQFPFDTAVPLFAFKNVQQLEIIDLDFRSFYGWDRLADQLSLLTIKRGKIDDPIELLEYIVLDDAEKRRRRSNRSQGNAPSTPSWSVPSTPREDYARSQSDSTSPQHTSPGTSPLVRPQKDDNAVETTPVRSKATRTQTMYEGGSPKRPTVARPASSYRHIRTYSSKARRSGSGSSNCSEVLTNLTRSEGALNNTVQTQLSASKWQRLVYLSLADNGLTALPERSIQPLVPSLRSLNLSSNLFAEIPDSLATLSRLVSLDLSNCMISSLQTLVTHPLPAITTLKLKSNRLQSLAGIERLPSLENLHIQDNKISDPDEAARLAQIPSFRKLWIRHNPLIKSFPDHRVRIMNHFRRSPGFIEDITIDDQQATYTERKQLIDRVAELDQTTLVPTGASDTKVILIQELSRKNQPVLEASNRLSIVTSQREPSMISSKQKRGPKRRIVDLSSNDSIPPLQDMSFETPPLADSTTLAQLSSTYPLQSSTSESKLLGLQVSASPPPIVNDVAQILTSDCSASDEYRRDVEDIRLKFGTNWLSALNVHHVHWQPGNDLPALPTTNRPPKLNHYHSCPPIVDIGGTST